MNPYHVPHHSQTVCTTPCCTTKLFDAPITRMAFSPDGHLIDSICAPIPTKCGTEGGTKGEWPQQIRSKRPKQHLNTHQDYWHSTHHEHSQSHSKGQLWNWVKECIHNKHGTPYWAVSLRSRPQHRVNLSPIHRIFQTMHKSRVGLNFFDYSDSKGYYSEPNVVKYEKNSKPQYDLILGTETM